MNKIKKSLHHLYHKLDDMLFATPYLWLSIILVIIGLGLYIGVSTGLFGTGGGATILVVLVYVIDLPLHTAIGTATALMAITAAAGVIGYSLQGHIPWLDGIIIGLAAMASGVKPPSGFPVAAVARCR